MNVITTVKDSTKLKFIVRHGKENFEVVKEPRQDKYANKGEAYNVYQGMGLSFYDYNLTFSCSSIEFSRIILGQSLISTVLEYEDERK